MNNQQFDNIDQLALEKIMRARRDVRGNRFSNTPVSQTDIDKILNAASLAPSVGFSQPWEFVIIDKPTIKEQILTNFNKVNKKAKHQFSESKQEEYAKLTLEGIQQSPVNIAVFYRPSKLPVLGQYSMQETGRYSVICAIQNMWLMARTLNIGIGWVSILDPQEVKNTLNAPCEAEFIAYLCVGHVTEFLDKPELEKLNWKTRKPIESVTYNNSY